MAAIAAAYSQGRLLLVGTTDLDAQQPVMWNIGAIAQSGNPRALDTIRRILLASAAMPGIFPPSMIDVTLDSKHYQEMHVDGGALAQAFLYPASLMTRREERISRGEPVISLEAYVIRNGRLDPQWSDVERRTLPIAARAISTMTTASGFNDVLRIYNDTKRDGIGFNLAYIDTDFTVKLPQPFDPGNMRALFDMDISTAEVGTTGCKDRLSSR